MTFHFIHQPLMLYNYLRTFTEPSPDCRAVLDAVSSLCTAIQCSLKLGVLCRCSFNVFVRRDVFMYIFKDSGCSVSRKPGRFYQRSDFCSEFFCDNDFNFVNNHNEFVRVRFPVYM